MVEIDFLQKIKIYAHFNLDFAFFPKRKGKKGDFGIF